jgi:hypothetical protein
MLLWRRNLQLCCNAVQLSFYVNAVAYSRLHGLSCCHHARVWFICNMVRYSCPCAQRIQHYTMKAYGIVDVLEFYFKVRIYVHPVCAYLMLLTVLLVCWISFGSVCGCPECFRTSGSLLLGGRPSQTFVVGVDCFDTQNAGRVVCCYLVFVSCSALTTGLCVSVLVSAICKLSLLILYMWYFSNVFKRFLFLYVLIMSIVYFMVPYLCPVFNMWLMIPLVKGA